MWFHRARAVIWLAIGIASFPLGWADSVVLVWIASVYANCLTDWGAAEASDDRELREHLTRVEAKLDTLLELKRGAR